MANFLGLLVFTLASCVSGRVLTSSMSFPAYHANFGRGYQPGSEEYLLRERLFAERAEEIRQQNARLDALWQAGFNEFTDRTPGELAMLRGRRGHGLGEASASRSLGLLAIDRALPDAVDWSNLTVLQTPKDQAGCGSCWAFATVNMLNAHWEIHKKETKYFSPQQFVSCVPNPSACGGTGGCSGATVELAMQYVEELGGLHKLSTLDELEYHASDGSCREEHMTSGGREAEAKKQKEFENQFFLRGSGVNHEQGTADVGLLSWQTLPKNQAAPLMEAVLNGPVAISAAASNWFSYTAGVYDGCTASNPVIDHAVLLTGYGTATEGRTVKYWKIMNSWGAGWGEGGFVRMLRLDSNGEDEAFCGMDLSPEQGIECKPYPTQVKVCGQCGMLYDSVAPQLGPLMSTSK